MNTFFLALYELFETNQAHFTDAGLPPVRTLDRFRGQPLNPEQFEYYELPALFIGYRIKWTKEGKYYNGTVSFDFHVVQDQPWETSNISVNRELGLQFELFHAKVRELLDDFETEITGKLERLEESPVDTGVVTYQVLSYTCLYQDQTKAGVKYEDREPGEVQIQPILSKRYLELPDEE